MKKSLIILICCFILAGCNNTLSLDFTNQIETKVNFSFTANEYKEYRGADASDVSGEIEAIINEARPLNDSYDELFEEISYSGNNDYYEGEYKYTYTYSNLKDSALLKRCFEYAAIEEENNILHIYLKGNSDCAPFSLKVKADNRMLSNNSNDKNGNEYIWKVEKENNDIWFNISKDIVKKNFFSFKNIVCILLGILIVVGIIILKKRSKTNN